MVHVYLIKINYIYLFNKLDRRFFTFPIDRDLLW